MQQRRLQRILRRIAILLCGDIARHIDVDGDAHGLVKRCLARVVIVECRVVVRAGARELLLRIHDGEVRIDTGAVADLRDLVVFLCLLDGFRRRLDVLLRCLQREELLAHVQLDVFLRSSCRFLRGTQARFRLLDGRVRHAVVKEVPVRREACRPLARDVLVKRVVARQRAHDRGIDRRTMAGLRDFDGLLRLLDRIVGRDAVRAVVERIDRAVVEVQVIRRVLQRILDVELRVRRQADDVVERGNREVVVVLHRHEALLRICELDFGREHVGFRDRADAELRIDVVQMFLQHVDSFLLDFDEVAILEHLIVRRCRLILDGLLRVLEREVGRVQRIGSALARMLEAAARVEVVACRERVAIHVVIIGVAVIFAADAVCRALPRERRPLAAARGREVPARGIDIRERLFQRAVVLKRHLDAVIEAEIDGVGRERRARAHRHEAAEHEGREFFIKRMIFLQGLFLLFILFLFIGFISE